MARGGGGKNNECMDGYFYPFEWEAYRQQQGAFYLFIFLNLMYCTRSLDCTLDFSCKLLCAN